MRCWRTGLTLLEVLAGLAILGSVAVSLLLARARFLEQHADAERVLAAVVVADALLAEWHAPEAVVPLGQHGRVQTGPDSNQYWQWRVVLLREDAVPDAAAWGIARLELTETRRVDVAGPALSVDFIVENPDVSEQVQHEVRS